MAGSSFGNIFRMTTWGESHGKGIGVVVDGCPAGLLLDEAKIQAYLDRRKPGQTKYSKITLPLQNLTGQGTQIIHLTKNMVSGTTGEAGVLRGVKLLAGLLRVLLQRKSLKNLELIYMHIPGQYAA